MQQTAGSSHVKDQEIDVDKSNQNHNAGMERMKSAGVRKYPPPSATNNTSYIATNNNNNKVSYVTSFWAKVRGEEIHPHRGEVEIALLTNIHNPHFDEVVVFLDRVDGAETCLQFRQAMRQLEYRLNRQIFGMAAEESNNLLTTKLKCVYELSGQPTYHQMFHNSLSDVITGDIVVLSNGDMAFDDTMSLARHLNPEVLAVLGTRGFSGRMPPNIKDIYVKMMGTDYIENLKQITNVKQRRDRDMCEESPFSWDTYIFHKSTLRGRLKGEDFKRLNENNELVPFYMNEMGSESAALWALQKSYPFTSVYNACDRIHSWHFHLTPKTHKSREIPWLQGSREVNTPMWTPKGSVPKPWGGVQKMGAHPFPLKNPDCVNANSCFLP